MRSALKDCKTLVASKSGALILLITLAACGGGSSDSPGNFSDNGSSPAGTDIGQPDQRYVEGSYRLALFHGHSTSWPLYGEHIQEVTQQGEPPEFVGFDANGWINRKLDIDIPGWTIGEQAQYQRRIYLAYEHQPEKHLAYTAYEHRFADRLLFLRIDAQTSSGTYKQIDFGQAPSTYGPWNTITLPEGWLLARTLKSAKPGQAPGQVRLDLQVVKLSSTGQLLANRVIEADFPGYGFFQTEATSNYLPWLRLERHYEDVILSGLPSSFVDTASGQIRQDKGLKIALDPVNLSVKVPFWIQANRFQNATQTPNWLSSFYMDASDKAAWRPRTTFKIRQGQPGYAESSVNAGWLEGELSSDYQSLNLIAYGVATGAPLEGLSHFWFSDRLEAHYNGYPAPQKAVFAGNKSRLYRLPELQTTSACDLVQGFGRFWTNPECQRIDQFYVLPNNAGPVVRQVHGALSVEVANPYESRPGVGGSASFKLPDMRRSWMEFDNAYRHPGCTTDKSYTFASAPMLATSEINSIQKVGIPATRELQAQVQSGAVQVRIQPYQFRAPLLCSDYKINLDHILTVPPSTLQQSTEIKPLLHDHYIKTILTAPAQGVYDAQRNVYSPKPGFVGNDSFRVLVDDSTGQQEVNIRILVR